MIQRHDINAPWVAGLEPRGWHRPVKPLALVLVAVTLLLLWLLIFSMAFWYFYGHWEARFTLLDQPVALRLPVGMPAVAEVQTPLHTRLDFSPALHLSLKQSMAVQLPARVNAQVQMNTTVPIDTEVSVSQDIPIHTQVSVEVPVRSWLPIFPMMLPVDLVLPLRMVVPIHARVPVALDVLVSGELPPSLSVPLDMHMNLKLRILGDLSARMVGHTEFRLLAPQEPFPVQIEKAALHVPFKLTGVDQRLP